MNRIKQAWKLNQQSFKFIKAHKQLLVFPLLSTVITLLLLAAIFTPLWQAEYHRLSIKHLQTEQVLVLFAALLIFFYFYHLIIAFFSSAQISNTINVLRGENVSIRYGLKTASQSWFRIALWILINTTAGIFIRFIESWAEKWESLDIIITYLAGITWMLATYFALPFIAVEKMRPIKAIKESSHLMHQTWGRVVSTNIGLGLSMLLLRAISLLPLALGLYLGDTASILIGSSLTVILFLLVSLLNSALHNVLCSVLYLYAKTGLVGETFDSKLLKNAFRVKKSKF